MIDSQRDIPCYIGSDWRYMLESKQAGSTCFRYSEFVSVSCFGTKEKYLKYPGWVAFFNGMTYLVLPYERCKNEIIKFLFPNSCKSENDDIDLYPEPTKILCDRTKTVSQVVINNHTMFNESNTNIVDIQPMFGKVIEFKKPETKESLFQMISCVFTSDQQRIQIGQELNSNTFQEVFDKETRKSKLSKLHIDYMCANVYFIYQIYHKCNNILKSRQPKIGIRTRLTAAS